MGIKNTINDITMSNSNSNSQDDFSKHEVKIVIDKKTIEKFTQSSPTLNHLAKYKVISIFLNYFLNLPFFSSIVSWIICYNYKFKKTLLESNNVPIVAKRIYQRAENLIWKCDEVFNYLILREGIDHFFLELNKRHYLPGVWLLWFYIDYLANFIDVLLKELVIKPFKISYITKNENNSNLGSNSNLNLELNSNAKDLETKKKSNGTTYDNLSNLNYNSSNEDLEELNNKNIVELPHLYELTSTTKSISKDIQEKLNDNYNSYIKPTTQKLTNLYIDEPKKIMSQVHSAKSTEIYKTVSGSYEENFKKNNESIPRAIVSTGKDIGSLTLEKLTKTKQQQAHTDKAKESTTPKFFKEKITILV
ncbi:hypothetical protein TPHA_0B03190 [Tetrapisispora phaffii CBS 4417]|uniref:Uncharacterized protein n=1 Tax=Tetrapisispora phaffii (strain ATCC 24235 / CBS 4417 / NBRC 1672 / NRRL Y-8282 / UCD 70-5) TaxID=1071381 RepID=G8BPR0_TETPH|nr:hypothetical protein TPHA_0B03190 [Tetrapisispora phaffii CBS 4417]CCE61991.1 hypothetical protein TPHA_0B03190 [Tetrapisispora phaffii CBS 4417]